MISHSGVPPHFLGLHAGGSLPIMTAGPRITGARSTTDWMRVRTRRAIGAAFLSLLIAVSFLATGGWFCADGHACMPALSPVCCDGCGAESAATASTGGEIGGATPGAPHLSREGRGCYRDLSDPPALACIARVVLAAPAALPVSGLSLPEPSSRLVSRLTTADPSVPPRFLAFSRDTRGPPAA